MDQTDIDIVADQTGVSDFVARQVLKLKKNVVDAIMAIENGDCDLRYTITEDTVCDVYDDYLRRHMLGDFIRSAIFYVNGWGPKVSERLSHMIAGTYLRRCETTNKVLLDESCVVLFDETVFENECYEYKFPKGCMASLEGNRVCVYKVSDDENDLKSGAATLTLLTSPHRRMLIRELKRSREEKQDLTEQLEQMQKETTQRLMDIRMEHAHELQRQYARIVRTFILALSVPITIAFAFKFDW